MSAAASEEQGRNEDENQNLIPMDEDLFGSISSEEGKGHDEDEKLNLIPMDEDPFGSILTHKGKATGGGNGIDKITSLPDDVIFHIFSFLPAKIMSQSSILSRRWRYLWALNPSINFKDDEWSVTRNNYVSIVNGILTSLSCLGYPTFKKFVFRFTKYYYGPDLVDAWLDKALRLDAREIELQVENRAEFMLPRYLRIGKSLVTLKLKIECHLQVSSFVCFPVLKSLHLTGLRVCDHQSAQNLFSSCPRLQVLIIKSCPWKETSSSSSRGFQISIDSLEHLVITDPPPLTSTSGGSTQPEVVINAPNLLYFEYKGYFATYYSLENTRLLADAFIDLDYCGMSWDDRHVTRVAKLLRAISSVNTLKLTDHTLVNLFYASEEDLHLLPAFYNLKHLELTGIAGYNFIKVLVRLLEQAPALESLVVSTDFYIFEEQHYDWKPQVVPQCLLSQLKTVTVRHFRGEVEEIEFVEYLTRNAQVLETLTIVPLKKCSAAGSKEQLKLSKKICALSNSLAK